MATKRAFPIKEDTSLHGFAHALKSAACEWLLLFLLLLDAAFSYFLTKFAEYCELQLPCILCSRLDHILGKEKPDFYRNLLCSDHKSEISSLVACHNHGKLVDVLGMCEECLLSFAKNESSEETYKLLVGKLGSDCFQKPLLSLDFGSGSLTTKLCSCCSKPWRSRPNVQKLVQAKPAAAVASKPDIPLPKSPGPRFLNRQEGLKKRKDRFSASTTSLGLGSTDFDSLSHVGYTEVKISSDSDSDFPFSDDDDFFAVPRNRRRDQFISQHGSKFIPKRQYDDVFPSVQFPIPTPATSNLMFPNAEPEKGETTTPTFTVSNGDVKQGLGLIKWPQISKKTSPAPPEFVSLDDIPLSSSAPEGSFVTSVDDGGRISLSKKFGASGFSDFISHKTAIPSKNLQLPLRVLKEKYIGTKEIGARHASAINNWESIDLNSTSTDPIKKNAASVFSNSSAIGARDLASNSIKDVKDSGLFSEELGIRACNGNGAAEEPTASKLSDPQTDSSSTYKISTVNGQADEPHQIDSSSTNKSSTENGHVDEPHQTDSSSTNNNSTENGHTDEAHQTDPSSTNNNSTENGHTDEAHRTDSSSTNNNSTEIGHKDEPHQTDSSSTHNNSTENGHADESQKTESSSTSETQMPPKSPTMERSHSLKSLEESVSEIEGESVVEKLKRQVEYDKERINNLLKELEEERNAAAIAANQALAMITKLQEEKAAVNMEALQYLRMMEEQAEYDVDALERANDMIAEKEKAIQDLETELDYFRIKYPEDFPEMNEEMLFADDDDAQSPYVESLEIENS